jgi:hypothetical protein
MKPFIPEIIKLPKRNVLTITSVGDPNKQMDVFPALYGTAYGTKFKTFKPKNIKMEIGKMSAFWPDAHLKPKSKWTGIWNLEIPDYVTKKDVVQKNPKMPVALKTLPAGTYGQVLYIGIYKDETKTIKELHDFIAERGYIIAGDHEEIYLTKPGPKAKTIIRYLIKRKK